MQIYKCYVPKKEYNKCKDLTILIYNILFKKRVLTEELTENQLERWIAKTIKEEYEKYCGTKPLIDILTEYYDKLKKEE